MRDNVCFLFVCFITYRRWGQINELQRCPSRVWSQGIYLPISPRFTPTSFCRDADSALLYLVNQLLNFFVLTSPRFPLQKLEKNYTPPETRTLKFRFGGRMLYPLDHGDSSRIIWVSSRVLAQALVKRY